MTADVLDKPGALDVHDVDGDPSGEPAEEVPPATTVEEAGDGTADPAVVEREHRLNRLRTYSELLQVAGRTTDRDSLARAADLAALYEDTAWVLDLATPKRTSVRGRPVDPKSRSRFATWARERTGLAPSTIHQLLRAHDIVSNCLRGAGTMATGEWALRPLTRLLKEHPDAIEPVWNDAVAEAGGAVPDAGHVKSAIRRWRVENGSGGAETGLLWDTGAGTSRADHRGGEIPPRDRTCGRAPRRVGESPRARSGRGEAVMTVHSELWILVDAAGGTRS